MPVALEGLSTAEASSRLRRVGPNRLPERRRHPLLRLVRRLWAPVPWMLETSIVLELMLGHTTQAMIILLLLLLNTVVGFFEERRARNALDLLRARLQVKARVLRDQIWQTVPAEQLVPGDVLHLRMGDVVPADVEVVEGRVSLDQSTLTGESVPVEAATGGKTFSGSVVVRGEATGRVTATGGATSFGRTAELVRTAHAPSHLERVILSIVRSLVIVDVALVAAVLLKAFASGLPTAEVLPFSLMLLVASVPVALPATFTLATAVGARELAQRGVLVTRLSAIENAASLDILCSDKTGTLTQNRLALQTVRALDHTEEEVLAFAALASESRTQDPIDAAILKAVRARKLDLSRYERLQFVPFDPATKRSEALIRVGGRTFHVIKGAPYVVSALVPGANHLTELVEHLGAGGERVLAVAREQDGVTELVGLLGFLDPPRDDAAATIQALHSLGVRTVMVTGDNPATARAVAKQVGIDGQVCQQHVRSAAPQELLSASVFANVLPEGKFHLVSVLQRAGHLVGMTGDGVNDAPALKQAEVGIALANATDVAKAAASIVLTHAGIGDVLPAVAIGREVYQRLLTYTLNKIIKTFHITLFLSVGFLVLGWFVVTPRHVVLLLLANDFVTMSLADDRVIPSPRPDRWNVRKLTVQALLLALAWVAFSFAVLALGRSVLHLPLASLRTLNFLGLVFSGQATIYLVRERRHFYQSRPSGYLLLASLLDVVVVSGLAIAGILLTSVPVGAVAMLLVAVLVYALLLDELKVRLHG